MVVDGRELPALCYGDPVEEVDALLDTFGVEGRREFGEEDPPVKGAGVVAAAERLHPLINAVVAQVVVAGESLREFRFAVVPSSFAHGVIGVGANGAIALIFGKVLSVDVRVGDEEGKRRWYWYRKVCMLVVSGKVSWGGSTLVLRKVLPASVSIEESGQMGVI